MRYLAVRLKNKLHEIVATMQPFWTPGTKKMLFVVELEYIVYKINHCQIHCKKFQQNFTSQESSYEFDSTFHLTLIVWMILKGKKECRPMWAQNAEQRKNSQLQNAIKKKEI